MLAGLDHARRGAVLFIDGDGQHPPALIETLVGHWLDDDCDVVYTAKANRDNESLIRRVAVQGVLHAVQLGRAHQDSGRRRRLPAVVAARGECIAATAGAQPLLQGTGELDRLSPDARSITSRKPRADGRTTWNTRRLIGLSLNGLTAFSVAPLRFATMLGVVLAVIAFIYGLQIVYETLVYGENVPGYPSLFVGIMVLGGMQLIMLGVVGEYIGKILEEIKGRPVYFVAEHDMKLAAER